jgi:hypothetical protein
MTTATPTKKAPAKRAPAKKAPAKAAKSTPTPQPKPAPVEVPTVDLRDRIAKAVDQGFGVRALNLATNPGTSFIWKARRQPVSVGDRTANLTAYLDKIESGAIPAPERVAAGPRAAGPTRAALLALVHDVRAAKSVAAVRELINAVVPPAS